MCVAKADTFDGRTYEAHVRCTSNEDGLALVSRLNHRSSINGFEVVGFAFKQVVYKEVADYKVTKDIFISCRAEGQEDLDAMENLSWEVETLIQ